MTGSGRTSSNRRRREGAAARWLAGGALLLILGVSVVLVRLSPGQADMPLLTVYAPEACIECTRWMEYLNDRGFRTVRRPPHELEERNIGLSVPPGFAVPMAATAGDFVILGFVPAREIHQLIDGAMGESVRGLVVPGRPHGAPGIHAAIPAPYTVYAVMPHGLLRPIRTYNLPAH